MFTEKWWHEKEWWIDQIKQIIIEHHPEELNKEYKSGVVLNSIIGDPNPKNNVSKDEIIFDVVKDISSMVNASGGAIIYGIEETKDGTSRAEKITPVSKSACIHQRQIESIVKDNISPPITKILVTTIRLSEYDPKKYFDNGDEEIIVVEVDRGHTAHMVQKSFGKNVWNNGDRISLRYYERVGTQTNPMSGSRVMDVMGRSTKPNVVCEPYWNAHGDNKEYSIRILLENCSNVVASNWKCVCKISGFKGVSGLTNNQSVRGASQYGIGLFDPNGEYSINGSMENVTIKWIYYSERVLHPTDRIALPRNIDNNSCFIYREALEKNKDAELEIIVYADAMVPKPLSIRLGDIQEHLTHNT